MKQNVNLLPTATSSWLERQYQIRWWMRTWLVTFLFLAVVSGLLQQAKQNDENRLQSAANSVADIRKASNQLESIRIQAESYRESVEFAAILEQRDLPLSLLQTIGECCQSLDGHLQLKSLKMTETSAGKSKRQPASVSSRPDNQPLQDSRQGHQVILVGVATPEVCSTCVTALKQSKVFDSVELISTQSVTEQSLTLQSFQILCERTNGRDEW